MTTISNLANLASLAASRAPSPYEVLYRLGLERRPSAAARNAARAGWVGLGLAVGSGLALLLTPRRGAEMRERLGEQAKRARDYVAPHEEEQSGQSGDSRARAPSSARVPRPS